MRRLDTGTQRRRIGKDSRIQNRAEARSSRQIGCSPPLDTQQQSPGFDGSRVHIMRMPSAHRRPPIRPTALERAAAARVSCRRVPRSLPRRRALLAAEPSLDVG
eukprot:5730436-Pleurochrysis_carterae.AAC.1